MLSQSFQDLNSVNFQLLKTKVKKLADKFFERREFPQCIGETYGTHAETEKPNEHEFFSQQNNLEGNNTTM